MKTYVISFISFFDNEMVSEVIHSDKTELEVLKEYLSQNWPDGKEEIKELEYIEECKQYCFDCDSMCNIIEVTDKNEEV